MDLSVRFKNTSCRSRALVDYAIWTCGWSGCLQAGRGVQEAFEGRVERFGQRGESTPGAEEDER